MGVVGVADVPQPRNIVRAVAPKHILVIAGVVHEPIGKVLTPFLGNAANLVLKGLDRVSCRIICTSDVILDGRRNP